MTFMPSENSRATKLLRYVEAVMTDEGQTVTYHDVLAIIECEPPEGMPLSTFLGGVVEDVNKRLHRAGDWRHLQNVMSTGYRIGSPTSLRAEAMGRRSAIERQMVRTLRLTEKVVRHPDASVAQRRAAADAANAQATLIGMVRREHRAIRTAWPEDEASPVVITE